jgi:hypothetical protein
VCDSVSRIRAEDFLRNLCVPERTSSITSIRPALCAGHFLLLQSLAEIDLNVERVSWKFLKTA